MQAKRTGFLHLQTLSTSNCPLFAWNPAVAFLLVRHATQAYSLECSTLLIIWSANRTHACAHARSRVSVYGHFFSAPPKPLPQFNPATGQETDEKTALASPKRVHDMLYATLGVKPPPSWKSGRSGGGGGGAAGARGASKRASLGPTDTNSLQELLRVSTIAAASAAAGSGAGSAAPGAGGVSRSGGSADQAAILTEASNGASCTIYLGFLPGGCAFTSAFHALSVKP